MKWNRLQTFLVVADLGSFSKAAKKLGVSQSAISRQVTVLEQELNCPMFNRHWSGLVLTEAGEELYATAQNMAREFDLSVSKINERKSQPEGPLKIGTTVAFGSGWLTPRLGSFRKHFPEVELSLFLSDTNYLDLSMRDADCAIRFTRQTELNLVQYLLGVVRYKIFASHEYIKRKGKPETLDELDSHELVVYGDYAPQPIRDMNWLQSIGKTDKQFRKASLSINSAYGIFRAIESGLGIGAVPYYLAMQSTQLVELLPENPGPSFEVLFVYPEELRHSRRIRVLQEFLGSESDLDISNGYLTKRLPE